MSGPGPGHRELFGEGKLWREREAEPAAPLPGRRLMMEERDEEPFQDFVG